MDDNISNIIDEYSTIRSEMLQRFERIHDIIKYLLSFYIVFLSFYFTRDNFSTFIALLIPMIVLFAMGLWIIPIYKSILNQGSYLEYVIENKNKYYHTMTRNKDEFLKIDNNKKKYQSKCFFNNLFFGKHWADDSAQIAKIIILLLLLGLLTVFVKIDVFEKINNIIINLNIILIIKIIVLFLIFILDITVIINLFFMNNFMRLNRLYWKNYLEYYNKKNNSD